MAAKYKPTISRDEYLTALALFTVANDHYVQCCIFAAALNRIVMAVPEQFLGGHVDDAIYSSDKASIIDFDEALRREGIAVLESPK